MTSGNPLDLPHYAASGAVHPDVVYFPGGFDGYEYWMAYTPYPPESQENPSVLRSHDGIHWTDEGISNPVISQGEPGGWNAGENADPDFLYVADLDKWFMVWAGQDPFGDERIGLAYSSDGTSWTPYDGASINGNADPAILGGDDEGGQAWESTGGISKLQCPTLFYENGNFILYYVEEGAGNNRGRAGFATFTWNNTTNDVENLVRYADNPTLDLPNDAAHGYGIGHIDLSKNPTDNLYYLFGVRASNAGATDLSLLTSPDLINWTDTGSVLTRGSGSAWDSSQIYRSAPVVDQTGSIVTSNGNIRLYYSAYGPRVRRWVLLICRRAVPRRSSRARAM